MNYEERQKKIRDEVTALARTMKKADLEKRFLRSFGCINFKDEAFEHELALAREYHRRHKKVFPELHDEHVEHPYRNYDKTVCKCGFSEECDTGD